MEKALEKLRQKSLSMVAENLEYFNCCKKDFAVSECKLWINKIFDRVNEELEEAMKPKTCDGCKHRSHLDESLTNKTTNGFCVENGFFTRHGFCCNRHEPKDNA